MFLSKIRNQSDPIFKGVNWTSILAALSNIKISLMMLKLAHKEAMQQTIKKGKNKKADISTDDFYDMPQQQSGMWVVACYTYVYDFGFDFHQKVMHL